MSPEEVTLAILRRERRKGNLRGTNFQVCHAKTKTPAFGRGSLTNRNIFHTGLLAMLNSCNHACGMGRATFSSANCQVWGQSSPGVQVKYAARLFTSVGKPT